MQNIIYGMQNIIYNPGLAWISLDYLGLSWISLD